MKHRAAVQLRLAGLAVQIVISHLAFVLASCGAAEPGIIMANIKFPFRVEVSKIKPVNSALSPEMRDSLRARADRREDFFEPAAQPTSFFGSRFGLGETPEPERVETFSEFVRAATNHPCDQESEGAQRPYGKKDTVVAIAISGGGARAGMLAATVMTLLERRYNEIAAGSGTAGPMIRGIDAFSTVSGGSLYAFHVARGMSEQRSGTASARQQDSARDTTTDGEWECKLDGQFPGLEICSRPERGFLTGLFFGVQPAARCNRIKGDGQEASDFFCRTAGDPRTRAGIEELSGAAFQSVIGPYFLSLGINLFTDVSYLDHLAKGLDYTQDPKEILYPFPLAKLRFRNVPSRPRLYFNATALEAGTPFLLTQSIVHLPPPQLPKRASRLTSLSLDARNEGKCTACNPRRPFRDSLTLEEIGSSPASFPVAYAAAASAAFPIGVEPLALRKWEYLGPQGRSYKSDGVLSLADGGVYDNSGMLTAVELFEYLHTYYCVSHFVLIAINADASQYDPEFPNRPFPPDGGIPVNPLASPLPFIGGTSDSLELIHFLNKRRGEDLAKEGLALLETNVVAQHKRMSPQEGEFCASLEQKISEDRESYRYVHYIPINLSQLSRTDKDYIEGGDLYYKGVSDIPTGYHARSGDAELLTLAAERILTARQDKGWLVGPTCGGDMMNVHRIDEAAAFAILRAAGGRWDDEPIGPGVSAWCESKGRAQSDERRESGPAGAEQ